MSNERSLRRDVRNRERESRRTKDLVLKGRQRLYRQLATMGVIALGLFGGGIGAYNYFQNQEVSVNQLFGVEKSQQEIELWQRVDQEIEQGTKQGTLTPSKKLELVTQAMFESQNPYFKDSATFFDQKYKEGRIVTAVMPSLEDNGLIESHPDVYGDKFIIGFAVNGSVILATHPLEVAAFIVHEIEHARNAFESNIPLANRSAQEQLRYQIQRIQNRHELIAEESRGYMAQAKAISYALGLMYDKSDHKDVANTVFKRSTYYMVEGAIRSSGNPDSPIWRGVLSKGVGLK